MSPISMWTHAARSALLPFAAAAACIALAGCATTQQASKAGTEPPATAEAAGPTTHRAVAEDVIAGLQSGDYARVSAHLDPDVGTMSADEFQALWEGMVEQLGALESWEHQEEGETGEFVMHRIRLRFERAPVDAMIGVDPESLKVQGLFFRPVSDETPAAPYVDPQAFTSREVQVGEGELALSGTLTVPNGEGPFPGVILLHGSGPLDRDSTVGANRPFRDLAEGLSSQGVVVLRFDKRTYEHPQHVPADVTLETEVIADGALALEVLGAQPEVDDARRFVLGHSLGALVAPAVAKRGGPVAGVILLAPPGRAPWDLVTDQLRHLGLPQEQLEAVQAQVKQLKDGSMKDEETFLGAPASYWRDWAKHNGIKNARELGVPLLILRGERDYQVTEADIAAWQKGLKGRVGVTIETLPTLNHLFIAGEGPPNASEYATPGHVHPSVLQHILGFMGVEAGGDTDG